MDLSVTLRPFGSLLLCLLVFLHRFLLFLGCLGLRFLLLLSRLLSLARTVWAGEDLSFSRYRPCKTQRDQQYKSRNSFHTPPERKILLAILHRSWATGLATESIAEHYTRNAVSSPISREKVRLSNLNVRLVVIIGFGATSQMGKSEYQQVAGAGFASAHRSGEGLQFMGFREALLFFSWNGFLHPTSCGFGRVQSSRFQVDCILPRQFPSNGVPQFRRFRFRFS